MRLIAGKYRAGPEAHASRSSPCTILHHEAFAPAGHHAQPEAGNALVPDEELRRLRLNSIDSAFGQFWHKWSRAMMMAGPYSGHHLCTVNEHIEIA